MTFVYVWEILFNESYLYQQTQTCRKTDKDQPLLKNIFKYHSSFQPGEAFDLSLLTPLIRFLLILFRTQMLLIRLISSLRSLQLSLSVGKQKKSILKNKGKLHLKLSG